MFGHHGQEARQILLCFVTHVCSISVFILTPDTQTSGHSSQCHYFTELAVGSEQQLASLSILVMFLSSVQPLSELTCLSSDLFSISSLFVQQILFFSLLAVNMAVHEQVDISTFPRNWGVYSSRGFGHAADCVLHSKLGDLTMQNRFRLSCAVWFKETNLQLSAFSSTFYITLQHKNLPSSFWTGYKQ